MDGVSIGECARCVVCGDWIRTENGQIMDVRNETACVKCIPLTADPGDEQLKHLFRGKESNK